MAFHSVVHLGFDANVAGFDVISKLLGPGGKNMSFVNKSTQVDINFEGIGSEKLNPNGNHSGGFRFLLSHANQPKLDEASMLIKNLIKTVRKDCDDFVAKAPPTSKEWLKNVDEHGNTESLKRPIEPTYTAAKMRKLTNEKAASGPNDWGNVTDWSDTVKDVPAFDKTWECELCDVQCHTQQKYDVHIKGPYHTMKAKLEGNALGELIDPPRHLAQKRVPLIATTGDSTPEPIGYEKNYILEFFKRHEIMQGRPEYVGAIKMHTDLRKYPPRIVDEFLQKVTRPEIASDPRAVFVQWSGQYFNLTCVICESKLGVDAWKTHHSSASHAFRCATKLVDLGPEDYLEKYMFVPPPLVAAFEDVFLEVRRNAEGRKDPNASPVPRTTREVKLPVMWQAVVEETSNYSPLNKFKNQFWKTQVTPEQVDFLKKGTDLTRLSVDQLNEFEELIVSNPKNSAHDYNLMVLWSGQYYKFYCKICDYKGDNIYDWINHIHAKDKNKVHAQGVRLMADLFGCKAFIERYRNVPWPPSASFKDAQKVNAPIISNQIFEIALKTLDPEYRKANPKPMKLDVPNMNFDDPAMRTLVSQLQTLTSVQNPSIIEGALRIMHTNGIDLADTLSSLDENRIQKVIESGDAELISLLQQVINFGKSG